MTTLYAKSELPMVYGMEKLKRTPRSYSHEPGSGPLEQQVQDKEKEDLD